MRLTVYVPVKDVFKHIKNAKGFFKVEGNFEKYIPQTLLEPPEGGCFGEDVSIFLEDLDITDYSVELFIDGRLTLYEAILYIADELGFSASCVDNGVEV